MRKKVRRGDDPTHNTAATANKDRSSAGRRSSRDLGAAAATSSRDRPSSSRRSGEVSSRDRRRGRQDIERKFFCSLPIRGVRGEGGNKIITITSIVTH